MKGISIPDNYVKAILEATVSKKVNKEETVEQPQEVNEEAVEEHFCPLCESKLDEELSEQKLEEHVTYLLSILNEELEDNGESLDEESEEVEEDGEATE